MYLASRNDNWLPSVFNDFFDNGFSTRMHTTAPAINVIEKSSEYDVELAAPGMTRDDVKVTLDEDENLVVAFEKKTENNEKKDGHYLRREFAYTKFHQTLLLPDDVDRDTIEANVANGVLTVKLPKKTTQQMQREANVIEVE